MAEFLNLLVKALFTWKHSSELLFIIEFLEYLQNVLLSQIFSADVGNVGPPRHQVTIHGSGGLGVSEASLLVDVADVGMHLGCRGPLPHSVGSESLVVHPWPSKCYVEM